MKRTALLAMAAMVTVLPATWLLAQAGPAPPAVNAARLEHGQYLVERVALCADCHTERDWKGKQDRSRCLQGSKLPFKPTRLMPWAEMAPPIAGLPSFANAEQAVRYFETGLKPEGKQSLPPMPQYRLSHEDAAAVVAYLQSLKPTPNGPNK